MWLCEWWCEWCALEWCGKSAVVGLLPGLGPSEWSECVWCSECPCRDSDGRKPFPPAVDCVCAVIELGDVMYMFGLSGSRRSAGKGTGTISSTGPQATISTPKSHTRRRQTHAPDPGHVLCMTSYIALATLASLSTRPLSAWNIKFSRLFSSRTCASCAATSIRIRKPN